MAKNYSGPTTQDFIPIKEIRDGIIVLEDGSLRALLLASAVNMALKSTEEQEAVIYQFQGFLNALEFPVQISVQSRRYDIKPYLQTLEERLDKQTAELLRLQTQEYIEFIRWFTDSVNIMSKKFFVTIPYSGTSLAEEKSTNFFNKIFNKKPQTFHDETERFEEQRSQLEQRISIVKGGLSRFGVRSEVLDTQQSIEAFYNMFNPGENHRSIPDLQ